jgi:hypothetical protein
MAWPHPREGRAAEIRRDDAALGVRLEVLGRQIRRRGGDLG